MIERVKILTVLCAAALTACSTTPTPEPIAAPQVIPQEAEKPLSPQETQVEDLIEAVDPPLTITANGNTLNLVRIMDGGICVNETQGASGSFLVYANPQDIERIKREQSKEVFKSFEQQIQQISSDILEHSVEQTNLAIDPFSLGEDDNREKLTAQLMHRFRDNSKEPLQKFKRDTTLTVDVVPFPPTLIFYQKGCDLSHFD